MGFLVVMTAVPDKAQAKRITDQILKLKLAACVTILPKAESHYVWKGKKETAREFVLLIKTKASLYSKLEVAIRKIHSYENPEIIAVSIQKGSPDYLSWIRDSIC